MLKIEPIKATSNEGGDVYRLLNLVHVMVGLLAKHNEGCWKLAETCSMSGHPLITTWTNGIVNIRAESFNGEHEYSLYQCDTEEPELL